MLEARNRTINRLKESNAKEVECLTHRYEKMVNDLRLSLAEHDDFMNAFASECS